MEKPDRPQWALFCRTAWTPEGQKTGLKPTMTRITKSFVCQRRVQIWRDGIFGGLGLHPQVDKAKIELEQARFDKQFDEKWAEFDGKKPSKEAKEAHEERIREAGKDLAQARDALGVASAKNASDLAEMKAAIDAMDKESAPRK